MTYPGEPVVNYQPPDVEYDRTDRVNDLAEGLITPGDSPYVMMPHVDFGKYVIFKTEDWKSFLNEMASQIDSVHVVELLLRQAHRTMVDDGIVIRRQDAFSPAPLHMYSLMIESTIAAIRKQPGGYNEEFVRNLQSRADFFHEEAMRAEEESYKIPD